MTDNSRFAKLTDRQVEVLKMLASGWTNKRIGRALCLTEKGVEYHRAGLARILRTGAIADFTRFAIRLGLVKA